MNILITTLYTFCCCCNCSCKQFILRWGAKFRGTLLFPWILPPNLSHSLRYSMKYSFQNVYKEFLFLSFFYQIIYLPHSYRVKATWKTTGLKERRIYHSSPQQSCATAVNRKTLRSSNGRVEKSRAVSTKESLIFFTQCGLRMPPVDLVRVVLIAPCGMRQKANWKAT